MNTPVENALLILALMVVCGLMIWELANWSTRIRVDHGDPKEEDE